MASLRIPLLGHSILGSTSRTCALNTTTCRAFTSCNRLFEDSATTKKNQATAKSSNRGVAVLKVPKYAAKHEIETLFEKAGLQIKRSQFRIDRFTFHNDSFYFAELATPEQAAAAVSNLPQSTTFPIIVRLLKEADFAWKDAINFNNRFIFDEGNNRSAAILPVKEGRRLHIRVETPFWKPRFDTKPKHLTASRRAHGNKLMRDAFGRFGIEAMSDMAFNDSRVAPAPKHFCHIDFETRQGADDAFREMNGKELEGRTITIERNLVNEVRARQIGRVDRGVLAELQALGLAPEVDWEEETGATQGANVQ